jgi:muramoyltetrapeptide carboxypeptidase
LRGGYGSIRILPELNKIKAPFTPKLLIGYSDITSLHVFLTQKWKWSSLHGPLIDRIGENTITPSEVSDLKSLIFGKSKSI